jgi:hypothetical protein
MMSGIIHTLSGRVTWSPLPPLIVAIVLKRCNRIRNRMDKVAALVAEGKYRPPVKRTTPPKPAEPGTRKPPVIDPRTRKYGWLGDFHPDMAPLRGTVLQLLQDPQLVELIKAAPHGMIPPLRSLCWMLGYRPPLPILDLLKKPRKPRAKKPKPEPEPPLEWDWNGRLSPEAKANVPHADPLIYRMGIKGVRRPKGTRRGPPKMA